MIKNDNGQVLIVGALLLALIALGMIVAMSLGGVHIGDKIQAASQACYEVVYQNGIKELVCQ